MLTLTSYMDETGHSDDPRLHFAGMGGLVAPWCAWESFASKWQEALNAAKLREPFHMKEFAHSTGQFKDWKGKEEKRRDLFGKLVGIIRETRATPVGAIVSVQAFRGLTPSQQSRFLILTTLHFRFVLAVLPLMPFRMITKP